MLLQSAKKIKRKGSDPPWSKLGRYPILHQLEESQAMPQTFKGKAKLSETPGFSMLALFFSASFGVEFFFLYLLRYSSYI